MAATIVPFEPLFRGACEALIAALPDWFGIPESNASYLRNLSLLPSWLALLESQVAGAITLEQHFPAAFEVHFMAVQPDHHRRGIGRTLLDHGEAVARSHGGLWLHVNALGPSHPDPFYARTRAFYAAMGLRIIRIAVRARSRASPRRETAHEGRKSVGLAHRPVPSRRISQVRSKEALP